LVKYTHLLKKYTCNDHPSTVKAIAKKMTMAWVAISANLAHLGSLFLPMINTTQISRKAAANGIKSTIELRQPGYGKRV
jgi:hypothetical protein